MAIDGTERDQQRATKESSHKAPIFTEQEIHNLSAFLRTLKRIHIRLVIEGYVLTPVTAHVIWAALPQVSTGQQAGRPLARRG